MRISDWSSDVCSSDLGQSGQADRYLCCTFSAPKRSHKSGRFQRHRPKPPARTRGTFAATSSSLQDYLCSSSDTMVAIVELCRSEEHTSELQSLMRISYAVFCLKKNKKRTTTTTHK